MPNQTEKGKKKFCFVMILTLFLLSGCLAEKQGVIYDEINEFTKIRQVETGWVRYEEDALWNPLFGFIRFIGFKKNGKITYFVEITLIKHNVFAILPKPIDILTGSEKLISIKNEEEHKFQLGHGAAGGYVGNQMPGVRMLVFLTETEIKVIQNEGIKKMRFWTDKEFLYTPSFSPAQIEIIKNNVRELIERINKEYRATPLIEDPRKDPILNAK